MIYDLMKQIIIFDNKFKDKTISPTIIRLHEPDRKGIGIPARCLVRRSFSK